ncbi:unnamed protein product [Protopolystoma xenopodis]|uniref:Uncharacterized protein n=1 Tax=Protopolystoma xenopodis TaxID=117903 RepID=A0A448XGV3_9PLAT|nr:unnamed protein product [Protopolystoma xenopodis]
MVRLPLALLTFVHSSGVFYKLYEQEFTPTQAEIENVSEASANSHGISASLMRTAIINSRQHEAFLYKLYLDLKEIEAKAQQLNQKYQEVMSRLHETMVPRMARITGDADYDAGETYGMYHVNGPTLEMMMHTIDSGQDYQ